MTHFFCVQTIENGLRKTSWTSGKMAAGKSKRLFREMILRPTSKKSFVIKRLSIKLITFNNHKEIKLLYQSYEHTHWGNSIAFNASVDLTKISYFQDILKNSVIKISNEENILAKYILQADGNLINNVNRKKNCLFKQSSHLYGFHDVT